MFTHSTGENQKTTKLDRIGKLAATQNNVVFNNIGHAIDLNLLHECYRQLDGNKAVGIDGVTKEAYGKKLEENLQSLLAEIRRGAYKPQAARMVEIPKEDGSMRPLAISCLEDKIVQMSVTTILNLIYEPLFLASSYGYRKGICPHDALKALMAYSNQNENGATVEIDLRKYFNSIPHTALLEVLENRISDKRFLKLIETLIRTPTMVEGKAIINTRGCPQGSNISAILSNVYLHYVIDVWFDGIKKTHIKGRAEEIRFADDMVFVFQDKLDAERFYKALPKRLGKFGLEIHMDKSSVISSGRDAAKEAHESGERLPTYKFLGFVCYWGQSRNGQWRLKYKSRPERMHAKLNGLRKYLKENLNQKTQTVMKRVNSVVKGWTNYHAISDNQRRVYSFILMSKCVLFRWRNRKGGQRKLNWKQFSKLLKTTEFPESFKTTSMFVNLPNRAYGS
jgi:group II intron reverse transcriptase/maturase